MKTRKGFVSNSSSSSFVMVGIEGRQEDPNLWSPETNRECYPQGYLLKQFNAEDWELNSVYLEDLYQKIQMLKEKFGATADIRLYMGTCAS